MDSIRIVGDLPRKEQHTPRFLVQRGTAFYVLALLAEGVLAFPANNEGGVAAGAAVLAGGEGATTSQVMAQLAQRPSDGGKA